MSLYLNILCAISV